MQKVSFTGQYKNLDGGGIAIEGSGTWNEITCTINFDTEKYQTDYKLFKLNCVVSRDGNVARTYVGEAELRRLSDDVCNIKAKLHGNGKLIGEVDANVKLKRGSNYMEAIGTVSIHERGVLFVDTRIGLQKFGSAPIFKLFISAENMRGAKETITNLELSYDMELFAKKHGQASFTLTVVDNMFFELTPFGIKATFKADNFTNFDVTGIVMFKLEEYGFGGKLDFNEFDIVTGLEAAFGRRKLHVEAGLKWPEEILQKNTVSAYLKSMGNVAPATLEAKISIDKGLSGLYGTHPGLLSGPVEGWDSPTPKLLFRKLIIFI
jgi:hypothetical protein